MKEGTKYFKDLDSPDIIVRKRPDIFELEYCSVKNPKWKKTQPNSSYEREFYFGEGNCCLFEISQEEAKEKLLAMGVAI